MQKVKTIVVLVFAMLAATMLVNLNETMATTTRTLNTRATRPYVVPNRIYTLRNNVPYYNIIKIFDVNRPRTRN